MGESYCYNGAGWAGSFYFLFYLFGCYMSSDLSEELAREKERADRAQAEYQAYKRESKEMQQLLQAESAKKENEIRRLMNESIMKEKNFKAQKTELAQLQNENAKLKEEVARLQGENKAVDPSLVGRLQEEGASLKKGIQQLRKELAEQKQLTATLTDKQKGQQAGWGQKQASLRQELQIANKFVEELRKERQILTQKLSSKQKPENVDKKSSRQIQLQRQSSKKSIKLSKQPQIDRQKTQQRLKQIQQAKRRLEQALSKSEKTSKQLRYKNQLLIDENESLQAKISALGSSMSNCNSQSMISPLTLKSVIEEEDGNPNRMIYSCLLLTKPHYVSPFLEIDEERNLLKILKSTRTGCFERSMGLYRHKFDVLAFEQDQIIDPIVNHITQSEQVTHHSVILFGVKKSSKKYLMARMVQKLRPFLLGKLETEGEEISASFIVRSQEEEKNFAIRGEDQASIGSVLEKVISKGTKSEKGKQKQKYGSPKKGQSKPKIRFFSFKAGDFYLQIGTSSFTGLSFRDKMTAANMLNNIIYSKLPDTLQSAISQKYLILTLNPIVDLYEDCRNTLSTTFCKAAPINIKEEDEPRDWRASPAREELNEAAKKKLESIERQNEQTSLKIRKLQQECGYFKSRFDELQFRLKNLLNTHAGQNSYLKKSPVTLSYEKLLKFVHSVQSRTAISLNATLLGSNSSMMLRASNVNMDKDADSPDAL